ncbi:MAG TPA: hypothetical protein VF049_01270 [Nocardioidaceae bacterium]|jgi:hypothetical protein
MGADDVLVIEVEVAEEPAPGAAPYVQFAGDHNGTLRGEVSSNAYLSRFHSLSLEQRQRLLSLGWSEPTTQAGDRLDFGSPNYFRDVEWRDVDRLAFMAVTTLREVFGVPHPVFLKVDDLSDADGLGLTRGPSEVTSGEAPEPLAAVPESYEHLQDLVDAALTPLFGRAPFRDEDGDIPVPYGTSLVYVRVEPEAPVVRLISVVVDDVTDLDRATYEVDVLNREERFLKFAVIENRVIARLYLPAWPFAPDHLRSMLTFMSVRLDELDEDLAARTGGRRAIEPAPEVDLKQRAWRTDGGVLDSALQTLLQLQAEGTGDLDPDLAASVCHFDRQLVLRLLRKTEEQEIAWRRSRDKATLTGDAEEADVCDHEMRAWERTTGLLRRALRVVVERDANVGNDGSASYAGRWPVPRGRGVPSFRGSMAPRPPRDQRISCADDLLHLYDAPDLVSLDEELSDHGGLRVEVFDVGDVLEIQVEGRTGRLVYPFTSADLHALLEYLHDTVLDDLEWE